MKVMDIMLACYTMCWAWVSLLKTAAGCTATPVATPACQTCSLATIQLTPMMGQGTLTPGNTGVRPGPNGCNLLTVTCDAGAGGTAFMQFNTNQGGPDMAMGQVVTADLVCNNNGAWTYTGANGQTRVITEVNCVGV